MTSLSLKALLKVWGYNNRSGSQPLTRPNRPFDDYNISANIPIQEKLTNSLLPALEAITPGGGAYLNEGDFRQPNFQEVFYGQSYKDLLVIKDKYDPEQLFYALTAVGSDRWATQPNGRLCRVYS